MKATFIDTSVLCELLDVPGLASRAAEVQAEFQQRVAAGERFIVPLTAVVETGNHIAQVKHGDRRRAAAQFVTLLQRAIDEPTTSPFVLHRFLWNERFLTDLLNGDGTGQPLLDLAGNGVMGSGDVSILVERDLLLEATAYHEAVVWTDDEHLRAHGS